MIENEDDDPVGIPPPRDPVRVFTAVAVDAGVLQAGQALTPELRAFAEGIITACAAIGDQYGDVDNNAGDHLRAEFLE